MVCVLELLRVANTPILDQFQLDEAFLNAKLALILVSVLVHIVQQSASTLGRLLVRKDLGHAHSNAVWSYVSSAKNRLMLAV